MVYQIQHIHFISVRKINWNVIRGQIYIYDLNITTLKRHHIIQNKSSRNIGLHLTPSSPYWSIYVRFVSTARFQVCWSVTQTATWMVDLHCEMLLGASRDKCFSAYLCHWQATCCSVKPGETLQTGTRLRACGRRGLKEWQNWELWSIYWSRMSPVPTRCHTVVGSQRQEESTAEKGRGLNLLWIDYLLATVGETDTYLDM